MIKSIVYLFLYFIIIFEARGQGIESTQRINNAVTQSSDGIVYYSLPRTIIVVHVKFSVATTICGPYAAFARELLGVNATLANNSEWDIDSISLQTITEADPQQMYVIKTTKGFDPNKLLQFTSNGLMIDPLKTGISNDFQNQSNIHSADIEEGLSEYIMHRNIITTYDTLFKSVVRDSTLIKIPVIKPKSESKTLKDRAVEAADIIYKIRQRRFEMVLSEDEALPNAKSMRLALAEMKIAEENYLSLFLGRTMRKIIPVNYYYTPKTDTLEGNVELFRFSAKTGPTSQSLQAALPVFISLSKQKRTAPLHDYLTLIPKPTKNYVYYRMPDVAKAEITYCGDILSSGVLQVFQYGVVLPFAAFGK
jgi:hypothetical protein